MPRNLGINNTTIQDILPVRSTTSNSLVSTQLLLVPVSRSITSLLSLATSFLTFTTRGLENSTNSGALVVTPEGGKSASRGR